MSAALFIAGVTGNPVGLLSASFKNRGSPSNFCKGLPLVNTKQYENVGILDRWKFNAKFKNIPYN